MLAVRCHGQGVNPVYVALKDTCFGSGINIPDLQRTVVGPRDNMPSVRHQCEGACPGGLASDDALQGRVRVALGIERPEPERVVPRARYYEVTIAGRR